MKQFEADGHTRLATAADIQPGVILRRVNADGSVPVFSDMVVLRRYTERGEDRFDLGRPYAFAHYGGELHGVERINNLGVDSLARSQYHVVLLASGKVYTCILDR